ncbi:hypothetical protein BN1723_017335, partial [Verticillium longisporum]
MKHGGDASKWAYIKNFDYAGTALYTGGLLIFMMGLNWGGVVYAWDSAHVIGTIVMEEDALPPGYFRSRFFIGSMMGIGLGLMAGVAGFGYAAPILGVINADIGPDPNIVWVALVYTLVSAVTLTIIGRVSDIFGRRYMFVGGAALGVIGSIVCAVAPDVPTLIGGMTIIGVAAATQLSYFYVMGEL